MKPVLLLASALLCGGAAAGGADIAALANSYRQAKSDEARFAIAKAAIDHGHICQLCPVKNVAAIFGTSSVYKDGSVRGRDGMFHGGVSLKQQPTSESLRRAVESSESARSDSWTLYFSYDEEGQIQEYFLTNLPKMTF